MRIERFLLASYTRGNDLQAMPPTHTDHVSGDTPATFKRIVIKLSGEILAGAPGWGIDLG